MKHNNKNGEFVCFVICWIAAIGISIAFAGILLDIIKKFK